MLQVLLLLLLLATRMRRNKLSIFFFGVRCSRIERTSPSTRSRPSTAAPGAVQEIHGYARGSPMEFT